MDQPMGRGWLVKKNVQSSGDDGDIARGRGSRLKLAGEHLMPVRTGNLDRSNGFELKVENLVEEGEKSGLGISDCCSIGPSQRIPLAQDKEVSAAHLLGHIGFVNSSNPIKEVGLADKSPSDNIESSSEIRAVNLGEDFEAAESAANKGAANHNGQQVLVNSSQIQGINIMVDLNDAGCRRRRRRQISNMLSLHELGENSQEMVPDSLSSEDDPIQSDSFC